MVRDAQVSSSTDISPAKLVQSASGAITDAANILDRGGECLGGAERAQLKELIQSWSEGLLAFASLSRNASDTETAKFLVHMIRTIGTPASVPVD